MSERTIRRFGISLTLPKGWEGRLFMSSSPGGLPVAQAASFPLPRRGDDFGTSASRRMGAKDVRIVLMEFPWIQVGTQGFKPTTLPLAIGRSDPHASPAILKEHAFARKHFAIHGRPFSLMVEFGRRPPSNRQFRLANRIIASLAIKPRPEFNPRIWKALGRPLRLRPLPATEHCPRTPGGRRAPNVAITLGHGPAYPVLGAGVANLGDDIRRGGWYWHKTLWAVDRRYRGPLLIRGARIDRPGPMRFGIDYRIVGELKMPALSEARWRYGVSSTLLQGAGCYAFQVDGTTFSTVIVFKAAR